MPLPFLMTQGSDRRMTLPFLPLSLSWRVISKWGNIPEFRGYALRLIGWFGYQDVLVADALGSIPGHRIAYLPHCHCPPVVTGRVRVSPWFNCVSDMG